MTDAREPTKRRKPVRRRLSRQQQRRRTFIRAGLLALGIVLLQPLSLLPYFRRLRERLRPPGSLEGGAFLGACIKCGQCVQVCPVEAIELADFGDGLGAGVPFIDPRAQACDFSCDALSCILACPTGALSHHVGSKEEVRIGFAELTRPESCLARRGEGFRGLARGRQFEGKLRFEEIDRWNPISLATHLYEREVCDLCVEGCPIGESALRLAAMAGAPAGRMTPVVGDGCVGCGVCEMVCPVESACIAVAPAAMETST